MFFLYLKVPFSFPFDPPEVRFLTRIFHPNVSRHGDIGIDSFLSQNWVLGEEIEIKDNPFICLIFFVFHPGLTIPKVLISIQSLLTDPYTQVCPAFFPDIKCARKQQSLLSPGVHGARDWRAVRSEPPPVRRRRPQVDVDVCHARRHAARAGHALGGRLCDYV